MRKVVWFISIIAVVMMVGTASALQEFLDVFDKKYDTLRTNLDKCTTCHTQGISQTPWAWDVPKWDVSGLIKTRNDQTQKLFEYTTLNPYGLDLKKNLNKGVSQAMSEIEILDSDKDKISNVYEINNLTSPGNTSDFPKLGKIKTIKNNNPMTQVKDVVNYSAIDNYSPP